MQSQETSARPIADKTAVSISVLCALHCLFMPIAVALLPTIGALGLNDEAFHFWMVFAVVPTSAFALLMGCRQHRRWSVLSVGIAGLLLLALAVYLGHDVLGELWERALTLLGSLFVAASHIRNYRLCQAPAACSCEENSNG
jgi:carbon starvation protein CstA